MSSMLQQYDYLHNTLGTGGGGAIDMAYQQFKKNCFFSALNTEHISPRGTLSGN